MMDPAEFARLLAIGLGRAILHLRDHDAAPHRDAILHACLHNLAYDRRVEGNRGQYLFDLISATGERDFYRAHLLDAAAAVPDDADLAQMLVTLRLFAADGDAEARQLLYDTFAADAADYEPAGADDIVKLDGLPGLLAIAGRVQPDPDYPWYASYLIGLAAEQAGEEETLRALAAAAATDPGVAAFMAAAEADRGRDRANGRADETTRDYALIRERLRAGDIKAYRLLRTWGRDASEEELAQAAADLLVESDPTRLRAYLRLFLRRRFPLDHTRLLTLSRVSGPEITALVITVLAKITHPDVRAFGLELWGAGRGDSARLLAANYHDGDYALLEHAATTWQDRDQIHALGLGLHAMVKAYPAPDAVGALLAHYERGPCSNCRHNTVEQLATLGALPRWLVEECLLDANIDLRAAMRERAVTAPGSFSPP